MNQFHDLIMFCKMKICRRFRDVNVNNLASQAIFCQCSIYSGLYSQKYKFA